MHYNSEIKDLQKIIDAYLDLLTLLTNKKYIIENRGILNPYYTDFIKILDKSIIEARINYLKICSLV